MRLLLYVLAVIVISHSLEATAGDEKYGRYFFDQEDVSNDYMIHFIYLVTKEDNEWDINGDMASEIFQMNEEFFSLTLNNQRFKLDMRKNGDLDISFVRLDRKPISGGWNNQYPDYYLQKRGFDNPKKLYFTYADYNHRTDGGQMGPHHGWLFLKRGMNKMSSKHINRRIKIMIHELVHGNGFSFHCTESDDHGHTKKASIISFDQRKYVLGNMIYGHNNSGCPDLKDSVYLTPTSENAYDPLALHCFLAEKSGRGVPGKIFEWPERYDHRAFDRVPKGRYWCTYGFSEYADPKWFNRWK